MIVNIKFYPLNGYDNLNLIVDRLSRKEVFKQEKWLNTRDKMFVTIYDDGFATYGLYSHKDDGIKDFWSSCAHEVNKEFNLNGTPYQLAIHNIGLRELESPYSCYFSCGILLEHMLKIGIANEESLKYGFDKFYRRQSGKEFVKVQPHTGLQLSGKWIDVLNTRWIKTNEGWLDVHECSDYILNKTGCWCLGDWLNKELI